MNKESKIYLAGHDGLVGSAIFKELKKQGYTNIITRHHSELDLRNQNLTDLFFQSQKPEYVFLAAAKVGGIVANYKYKAEFIYDNIMIASNVIHASWKNGVKKLLNLGSSCIYPKLAPQPLKEEYLLSGYLEETNDAYAMAKIAAIMLCNSFNQQYGTNFISAMPTNLYGPGDNFNLETSHVLPAIVRKMHLGKCLELNDWEAINRDLNKNPIEGITGSSLEEQKISILNKYGIARGKNGVAVTLWGDGSPGREFLYSKDLAEAVVFMMENVDSGDLPLGFLNIGSGEDQTIKELAEVIGNIVGFTGQILWDKKKPNGTPRKLLDVSQINKLGWKQRVSLRDGISILYEKYIS
ncbi:MAG: GDP-L-fucose synthase [Spirochaetota bacterium]